MQLCRNNVYVICYIIKLFLRAVYLDFEYLYFLYQMLAGFGPLIQIVLRYFQCTLFTYMFFVFRNSFDTNFKTHFQYFNYFTSASLQLTTSIFKMTPSWRSVNNLS
uniref:Uncharacterized protein n=1 Tax=Cacopsylla melanoneura TaxID=428564 RepID=A0A8D9BGA7_9HEMI